jgi:hypothetical protein
MAEPNLVSSALTINGRFGWMQVTTSATALLTNPANSGKILRLNSLLVTGAGAASSVTLQMFDGSTTMVVAFQASVPLRATIDFLINRPLYVPQGYQLQLLSTVASAANASVSYEEIS